MIKISQCVKCQKQIHGDDLYEVKGKVFCEDCATKLTQDSPTASPTGIGCIGSYAAMERQIFIKAHQQK
ncbi:MAG: hypothetical protein RSB05_00180 [Clostridiales bacterium]